MSRFNVPPKAKPRPSGGGGHFSRAEIIQHGRAAALILCLQGKPFKSRAIYDDTPALQVLMDAKAVGDSFGAGHGGCGLARSTQNGFLGSRDNAERLLAGLTEEEQEALADEVGETLDSLEEKVAALKSDSECDSFFLEEVTEDLDQLQEDQEQSDPDQDQDAEEESEEPED